MRPYSMAVAPDSSFTKRANSFDITEILHSTGYSTSVNFCGG
jgi:hypothetical protein